MPSTGTPSSNTVCGARAVSSSVTEAWLPERITPRGLNARTKSASTSCGCSSQYTPLSRTRRAISWATWEPKSSIRILSRDARFAGLDWRRSIDVVIGRFLGDLHVVDVRLAHPRRRNLDEVGACAHLFDGAAAGIAHARTQAAHQLSDDGAGRPLVGNAALDTLGHELVGIHFRVLEIAVARSLLHRAERSHA